MENGSPAVFRLSPLQKILWSNIDLRGASVYARAVMEGAVDLDRLQQCFRQVGERHESLRTFFQLSPGFAFPFQVVRDAVEFSWEFYELTATDGAIEDAVVEGLLAPDLWPAATPFEGPTFGVKVIRIAPDEHILALRALALCCDHVSLAKLLAEVAALYGGEPGEESVQYADFAEWHEELLLAPTEDSEVAKDFWATAAASSVQVLPLASRFTSVLQSSPASYRFAIDADAFGETIETLLLSCWQSVLWRLTNQDAVSVDVTRDGRPLEDLELSIGLFARPFAVSTDFANGPAFDAVMRQASEALSGVERWQAYCPIDPSGTVGFEFRQLPGRITAGHAGITVTALQAVRWPSKLALVCQVSSGKPAFEILYDAAQYAAKDVERIAKYFERAVRASVADAAAKVSTFDLLDAAERAQVVEAFNSERVEYGDARLFHQLFEEQAALTPERTALVFEKTRLTYAELNARANQVANWLRKDGVSPNTPVGLCLERSAEMIVALLGILKAGGAYVPLLPDLPAARMAHQLAETGIQTVVSAEALLERLSAFKGRVLCLDRDATVLDAEPAANLSQMVSGQDLMYVLYTSGSTGTPKGVAVRHNNVANYIHGMTRRLGLREVSTDPGLAFATVSTLGADLGNTSIFPPLVTGGLLTVISYDAAIDGGLFAERNREQPIDVLKITPSNLNALLASEAAENILPRKMLITGGEACTWDLVERVEAAGVCRIMNHYGPTEATIGCLTFNTSEEKDQAEAQTAIVPLGRPLPNVQVYVLDGALRPVPVGVPGEICVSGAGIAQGYIGRPEETQQKFVAHPFLPNGSALYRTGDLGRMHEDGSVEFLGRVDDQVKIRGHRVELAEIESVLNQCSGVQQAVVLLTKDEHGDALCAYLAMSPPVATGDLQAYLRQHLPEYMVPRDFVIVEQMPLNANGKIDRRKLAELKPGATKVQSEIVAPRTELEEQLAQIWMSTLHCERVSVRDNFFDLGGHSLLATQVISRVRSSLGLNVSIRMLFEAPTIELLAQAIETTRTASTEDAGVSDLLSELEGLSDSEAEEIVGGD